jgi:hypothetical protein
VSGLIAVVDTFVWSYWTVADLRPSGRTALPMAT